MTITVQHQPDKSRYEATTDGEVAGVADYIATDDALVFTHTEIDPACEGRGIGSQLIRFAMDDVRERGLKALPTCPFVQAWLNRHPDYADLDYRRSSRADG